MTKLWPMRQWHNLWFMSLKGGARLFPSSFEPLIQPGNPHFLQVPGVLLVREPHLENHSSDLFHSLILRLCKHASDLRADTSLASPPGPLQFRAQRPLLPLR